MFDGEKCARCNEHFKFEELTYGADAYGLCAECYAALDPDKEPLRMCPHDGQQMDKEILFSRVLIDKCPACDGMWLDGGELEVMKTMLAQEMSRNSNWLLPYMLLMFGR
jgi:hypothetical protein